MYKLISAKNPADAELLSSMHNLRFRVFKQRLNWVKGDAFSRMEYDQYDTDNAIYIVKIDPADGKVCACTRLIETTQPYLLGDTFPEFLQEPPIRSKFCYETSRFAADIDKKPPTNITGELIAAMLEFGTYIGIHNYVSLSDLRIERKLLSAGWDPQPLGPAAPTANETSIAFKYTVSEEMLENVRLKSNVGKDLIKNLHEFCSSQLFNLERAA